MKAWNGVAPSTARGLFELARHGVVVALDQPDVLRHAAGVGQRQAPVAVDAEPGHEVADAIEQGVDRHQREHRREHLQQQQAVQHRVAATEAHAREGVGAGDRQQQRDAGRDERDLQRVPDPQQHRKRRLHELAVGVEVGDAERELPVLEADVRRDQVAAGEVAGPQRDRQDHQEREHRQRDEREQPGMREQHAPAVGFLQDDGHGADVSYADSRPTLNRRRFTTASIATIRNTIDEMAQASA